MTVITNLVVALMIVSSGEEPVQAMPVIDSGQDNGWSMNVIGGLETLYRKTTKTNFVYSAGIKTEWLERSCHHPGCDRRNPLSPQDLFGHDVAWIGFHFDYYWFCGKHCDVVSADDRH